ncbi:DUF1631 family protein [Luteibacter aegosomatissinici]|uniref:DUF1631 family protein n=1 Tax=Luteibacter aegosomatissinici TaxID=2911539 RepID=UPI001FF960CC|nr:DUF1631 family protein [Luteibacter aegosomatissinici]UPG94019.1 DUF1631 domain-containing protein [Luteibacter aegosomatissinici]
MNPGTPPFGRTGPHPVALSPRAEREAQQGLSLCLTWLDMPLREALRDFDQRLFAVAESSRNHLEQQDCFESRGIVQREGPAFRNRFASHLSERFRHLGEPTGRPAANDYAGMNLSLVDPEEQEQTDALSSMAARAEARSASSLFELGYRLAVLAGTPPLEGEALPAGPRALTAALQAAMETMPLTPAHRLILFQAVDTRVLGHTEAFYGALNEHYRTRGILPGFRVYPNVRVSSAPAGDRRARAGEGGAGEAGMGAGTGTGGGGTGSGSGATPEGNIGVLESLRQLLSQRAQTGRGAGFAPGRLASDDELQTALLALQGHVSDVTDAAQREIRTAGALRDELLAQLNRGRPAGSPLAELTIEQGDTVELTAMLFQNLGQQMGAASAGRRVLGGLQWPMLRAAVNDRGFFDQPEHPARQLLNTVSEAAHHWLDPAEGEPDNALLDRLERLVVDASAAQVIDPAWRADIETQIAQLSRKAHVAERRQIEAMEGRDRLERARQRAGEVMSERMVAGSTPRGVLRILLERTWADVLALHILRGGETGEAYLHCLGVTDQLLGRRPVTDKQKLRQEVERGLEHLGMHPSEAAQVAAGLFEPAQERQSDDTPTATDVAMRLKQRPRLGEGTAHGETVAPVEPTPLDTAARAVYDSFASLRFGTWFEFTQADGEVVRRKLAWFSPATGRCLFVNQRGMRTDDIDLTRLARMVSSGEAREWREERVPLIDRAWQAVARALRRERMSERMAGHA